MHALLGARCVGPGDGVVHAHRLEGLSPDRLRGAKFAVAVPIIFRFNYDFRPLPHDYNPKLTWPSQLLILSLKIPQVRAAPSVYTVRAGAGFVADGDNSVIAGEVNAVMPAVSCHS